MTAVPLLSLVNGRDIQELRRLVANHSVFVGGATQTVPLDQGGHQEVQILREVHPLPPSARHLLVFSKINGVKRKRTIAEVHQARYGTVYPVDLCLISSKGGSIHTLSGIFVIV